MVQTIGEQGAQSGPVAVSSVVVYAVCDSHERDLRNLTFRRSWRTVTACAAR